MPDEEKTLSGSRKDCNPQKFDTKKRAQWKVWLGKHSILMIGMFNSRSNSPSLSSGKGSCVVLFERDILQNLSTQMVAAKWLWMDLHVFVTCQGKPQS